MASVLKTKIDKVFSGLLSFGTMGQRNRETKNATLILLSQFSHARGKLEFLGALKPFFNSSEKFLRDGESRAFVVDQMSIE